MNDFKGRHFEGEVVLRAVRWYCRYTVSYRDLEAMMSGGAHTSAPSNRIRAVAAISRCGSLPFPALPSR